MKTFTTLMLIMFLVTAAQSQPGSLDASFSHNGKNTAQIGNHSSKGTAVAIDSHRRIVVAGIYDNPEWAFGVCRFKQDGSLDNSFGDHGTVGLKIFTPGSGYYLSANAVAVQSDNKIIIVGDDAQFSFSNGYIARVNADGTPDYSFGGG